MKFFAALVLVTLSIGASVAVGSETPNTNPKTQPHGLGLLMDTDRSPVGSIYDHSSTTT